MKNLTSNRVLLLFGIFMLIMFIVVMFIVNPLIDNKNGLEVIKLQLLFNKEKALALTSSWSIDNFKRYIFTDYIYAISYTLFLSSLLLNLINKNIKKFKKFMIFIYLVLVAGLCDWIENSLELYFFANSANFSNSLFILHSTISLIKWLALPIVLASIVILIRRVNANNPSSTR